ncbi:MAG: FAD-dependent oxidoreductase [Candidatus Saccharimonas sp.]
MKITIVGGGFGGVKAALELSRNSKNTITLISDKPNFQYYPTLYSSATGRSHRESWTPLGEIFADRANVFVSIDTIESLDAEKKCVVGSSGTEYPYETIIFSLGVVTTYFGIPGLDTYTYGIKSEEEILRLKQRLFIDIAEKGQIDSNYVIIGGGPTGVELSAAIGTYIKRLCRHYKVKNRKVNVRLIEAMPRILPRSSELVSRVVTNRLKRLGVSVETGKKVESASAESLAVSGTSLSSHTVIWTSGVSNHPFFAKYPDVFKLNRGGRVEVDQYLSVSKNIFVIGDNAVTPYMGLAQTAVHNAVAVARNLERRAHGKKMKAYKPLLPATAVPVGRNWAVVEWRGIRVFGLIGSIIRRAADIVGFHDILPFGTSIGAWRAAYVYENNYFTPSSDTEPTKSKR